MSFSECFARVAGFCVLGVVLNGLFTNVWWPAIPVGLGLLTSAALVGRLTRR